MRCWSSAAPDRRRRALAALVGVVLCLFATSCRAEVDVAVDVGPDGTGELAVRVELDADAARRLADDRPLVVDDLRAAGWTVEGPQPKKGGGVAVTARHRFDSPDQFDALAAQLTGDGGPFDGLRLRRERSLARTRLTLTGTVDNREGAAAFGDADLTTLLGGQPFGVAPEELQRLLAIDLADAIAISLSARLPGDADSNATSRRGDVHVWAPTPGQLLHVAAAATTTNTGALAWAAVAALLAGGAVAAAIRQRVVRRRRLRT